MSAWAAANSKRYQADVTLKRSDLNNIEGIELKGVRVEAFDARWSAIVIGAQHIV